MIFYFLKEGVDEIGPLTLDQLKCSTVKKDTPVWFAGLEEWTTAEDIHELKELFDINYQQSMASKNRFAKIWNRLFKKKKALKTYKMIVDGKRGNLN